MFTKWRKKIQRKKVQRTIENGLQPTWLFDRGNYVWILPPGRHIKVTADQVGNWIVYDGLKMVSRYMKTPDEAKRFATGYIADEIMLKYFNNGSTN